MGCPLPNCRRGRHEASSALTGVFLLGVRPSAMYSWSDHANCVGCVKGGKAYWLAVKENAPEIFEQRKRQESFFGHQMFKGHVSLSDLERDGMKREAKRRELY